MSPFFPSRLFESYVFFLASNASSGALKIHKYNQGPVSVALGVINTAIYKTVCVLYVAPSR